MLVLLEKLEMGFPKRKQCPNFLCRKVTLEGIYTRRKGNTESHRGKTMRMNLEAKF
jgi:hypothetical protein